MAASVPRLVRNVGLTKDYGTVRAVEDISIGVAAAGLAATLAWWRRADHAE